jgi:uncharacterized protein (DUF1015 family)
MADFRSFRAWRYDLKKVPFAGVIAPPYDVISEEGQQKLYDRSPYNCIRLILNQKQAADNETHNVYSRARHFFNEWRSEQVLLQDEQPCFYFYRQVFRDPASGLEKTRQAILGRLKLEPFEKGVVVPHEKTLSKPKEDRRKLLEATQTNFSPIFGLYDDPQNEILAAAGKILQGKPDYDAVDDDQVRHEVWVIRDSRMIEQIHEGFSKRKIYIADGHHRYQTALDHSLRIREREKVQAGTELPSDFMLMAMVEMNDPGLVLMSTHRMILPFEGFQPDAALRALDPYFKVEAMTSGQILAHFKKDKMSDPVSMGLLLTDGRGFLITLKDIHQAMKKMAVAKPELWCKLDVTLLSHLILAKLWNLPDSQWESVIRYTHSGAEAVEKAQSGQFAAVFLLKDPPVKILREMGELGELLPQKTTYFYPKLASGLVFYHHQKGDHGNGN